MSRFLLRLILPSLLAAGQAVGGPAVVRVLTTHQSHDSFLPWRKGAPGARQGYGVYVGTNLLLTTETLVRNHTLVEIQRAQAGEKHAAAVLLADPQVNLALLRLDNGVPPPDEPPLRTARAGGKGTEVRILQFDTTAEIQSGAARVVQISIDELPRAPYTCLSFNLLTDLNVNGEGAPALVGDRLAGLILSYNQDTRIAGMLPYPVIDRFLAAASESPYEGFAAAGFLWKPLVSPARRRFLGVQPESGGIMVLTCVPGSGADAVLEARDVVLSWDGHAIDNLGYYQDPDFGRLRLSYLIKGHRSPGESVPVELIRDGKPMRVNVALHRPDDRRSLIPENVTGRQPEYLVEGGLVLRELTGHYLRSHGAHWQRRADTRLVHYYQTRRLSPEREGQRIVILSGVLPAPINIGYHRFSNQIVTHVNGEPVNSMADLFRIRERDGYLTRFALHQVGVELVLDRDGLPEANRGLTRGYGITALSHRHARNRR